MHVCACTHSTEIRRPPSSYNRHPQLMTWGLCAAWPLPHTTEVVALPHIVAPGAHPSLSNSQTVHALLSRCQLKAGHSEVSVLQCWLKWWQIIACILRHWLCFHFWQRNLKIGLKIARKKKTLICAYNTISSLNKYIASKSSNGMYRAAIRYSTQKSDHVSLPDFNRIIEWFGLDGIFQII